MGFRLIRTHDISLGCSVPTAALVADDVPAPHPLVLATLCLLAGVVLGMGDLVEAPAAVGLATGAFGAWVAAEPWLPRFPAVARVLLALSFAGTGALLYQISQRAVEPTHLVRWAADVETPVTLRAQVLVPPDATSSHGDLRWVGRAQQLLTSHGWVAVTGDILVRWRAGEHAPAVPRGGTVELYGWLARPPPALNPGGYDSRARLAADRIFATLRVPRATGVVVVGASARESIAPRLLDRFRLFLRGKLLQHTLQDDVPAAYTLSALLLGYRDPAIGEVSQAFADAGVAHLLAISGSHIVFFTGIAWGLLRWLPMRPRLREVVIAAVVGLYVLATPCGPPVMRAAVALALVVLARLAGRPGQYLNMLAAAAGVIVLLRPTDLADAGFQLSFASTAGLLLLARRTHAGLFGRWLERETLVAALADTRAARVRISGYRYGTGLVVANLLGALTAGPLVAFHFGQVNLWAVVAGLAALPAVSVAMVAAAIQLVAELVWSPLGAWVSPVAVGVGRGMIWLVTMLAHLPAAAVAVRPPPAWAVGLAYAAVVLWMLRRRWGLSRAAVVNATAGVAVVTSAWYAWTQPVGGLELTALSNGQAAALLLRTPAGGMWAIDAGADRGAAPLSLVTPALRRAGTRSLEGLVVTSLDAAHAGGAADLAVAFRPAAVVAGAADWPVRGQTLAGASLGTAAAGRVRTVAAGQAVAVGGGARLRALWPPERVGPGAGPLVLLVEWSGRRVLIADPRHLDGLALALRTVPALRCDAVVLTGPRRGAADAAVLRVLQPLGAAVVVWNGRGAWASRDPTELNTRDGAVRLEATADRFAATRAP
jgi:competence protein ComEC